MSTTEISFREYLSMKNVFFSVHHYMDGDKVLLLPLRLLVKTDKYCIPIETHVKPYKAIIPQPLALFILLIAENHAIIPAIKSIVVKKADTGVVFSVDEEDAIPSPEEFITLLEDLPFPVSHGVLQSYYKPPKNKLGENTVEYYMFTSTIYSDVKVATSIIYYDNALQRLYAEFRKRWTEVVDAIKQGRNPLKILTEYRGFSNNVSRKLEMLKGRTIVFMRAGQIGILPIINI